MSILVAVDGGGSRCRLAAFNETGDLLARVNLESHASPSISPTGAWRSIDQGLRLLAAQLKKEPSWQPDFLMMGLAGSLQESRRRELLQLIPPSIERDLVTDGHAQLLGASGGAPGICLAVGTGSVVHWLDTDGQSGMAGGWGYPIGDEGSGAWLGMRLVQRYVWHFDGQTNDSTLMDAVAGRVGTSVSDIQQWTTQSESSVLAQLAPLVFEHASAGDELAESIVDEAVSHCMNLLRYAPEHLPVYIVGGVGDQLRPLLSELLAGRVDKARGDALHGLWQLALKKI